MNLAINNLLEEETSTTSIFSSSNLFTIALTVGIVIVTAIAVYLLVVNQKLTKKLKEAEEEKE